MVVLLEAGIQALSVSTAVLKSASVRASAYSGDFLRADPRLLHCHLGPAHQNPGLGSRVNRTVIVT